MTQPPAVSQFIVSATPARTNTAEPAPAANVPALKANGNGNGSADEGVHFSRLDEQIYDRHRRFDVADITDENRARWARMDRLHINQLLQMQLRRIHEQVTYECRNNATVTGTIETHAKDVVGRDGPRIQIESDNDSWNMQAEQIINEWLHQGNNSLGLMEGRPQSGLTADGRHSLGGWLKNNIRDWWQTGDMLTQLVEPDYVEDGIRLRLHELDSRGLIYTQTPDQVILGIRRDRWRRPIMYYVSEFFDTWGFFPYSPVEIPASEILHDFSTMEVGQIRGFPIMTAALDPISELRQHDSTVMRAAQKQALLAVLMQTQDQTLIDPVDDPDEFEIRDGSVTRIPPGWNAQMPNSSQPSPNHLNYRTERLRELGYPVGMPLMKLRHDSSGHNYATARYDGGDYQRVNEAIQSWLWRRRVLPLVLMGLRQAFLYTGLPARSVRRLRIYGRWDKPPHADPVKEALAAQIRLNSRTTSPITEALQTSADFEQIAAEWKRANELLVQNGMPPMFGPVGGQLTDLENYLSSDDDDNNTNGGENVTQ